MQTPQAEELHTSEVLKDSWAGAPRARGMMGDEAGESQTSGHAWTHVFFIKTMGAI